jgi:hypothetical protein
MSEENKIGTPWQSDELDAIIASYFQMLTAELARQSYVKAKHSATLMAKIGRSHRSVEFKNQNISAVLEELGLPWIPGYKPKRNYQNSIFPAIDRFLTAHPAILEFAPIAPKPSAPSAVFVPPPERKDDEQVLPIGLKHLIRKFDPVQRDHRNRNLGKAGEAFVVEVERQRLAEVNRVDLADRVRWIADEDGDGAGYDVLSFNQLGHERLIEVKTTNGASQTPFFLTRNERALSEERTSDWCIYRVHLFAKSPRIFCISPPLESAVNMRAEVWRASF